MCIADSDISTSIDNPGHPVSPAINHNHIMKRTHRSTTSHSTQQTRCGLIRRLVLTAAQPRNRNDLLHRLTSNPVTSRRSRIRRDNLAIYHQPGSNISLFFFKAKRKAYNSTLESESQRCRSVGELNGAVRVRVVIGHRTEETRGLERQKPLLVWARYFLKDDNRIKQ